MYEYVLTEEVYKKTYKYGDKKRINRWTETETVCTFLLSNRTNTGMNKKQTYRFNGDSLQAKSARHTYSLDAICNSMMHHQGRISQV